MPDRRVGCPRVTEQSAMFTKNIQLAWLSRISIAVTSGRINQNYGSIYSIGRNWPSRHKRMSDETSYIPSPHRYIPRTWKHAHHRQRSTPSGLAPLCRGAGDYSPSAHICTGPWYLSFPVPPNLRHLDALEESEVARTAPGSLSPYPGMVFKPFGLPGRLEFEHPKRPQTLTLLDGLREFRAPCQTGELPQYQPSI